MSAARSHALGDIPRRTARRHPTKTAIIHGPVMLTFTEFDELVDRAAAAMCDNGFEPGYRVALLARNCWQYAVLAFATARAGVVLVPVNFMLMAPEIAYILKHCGATGFIVQDELRPTAEEAMALGGNVTTKVAICTDSSAAPTDWHDFAAWLATTVPAPRLLIDDDQLIRVMYTSGTESRPKGVMLSSRSLVSNYVSTIVDGSMSAHDIELHSMPMYHCAQLDNFLATDIYLGATSVIVPRPDPEMILRSIEAHRVTNYFAPPTVWISLLRSPVFDLVDLSSLRKGYYGASAMPIEILREIRERLPDLGLWNFYGQTEMAPLATVLGPEEQDDHAGAAGYPVMNVETMIVDESGAEVADGMVGEIVHRSPHLTLGYLDDPAKTAETFRGGWFHSGDLGFVDQRGLLHVVDRKKDMIKTGGENVASREVEEVLYAHNGVQEAVVFGVPHPVWVEAVTAAVVARDTAHVSEADLLAHCRERLAGYKIPKRVIFVASLPKNPSGKILKRQLREQLSDSARREQ